MAQVTFQNNATRFLQTHQIHFEVFSLGTDEKLSAEETAHRLGRPFLQVYKTLVVVRERKARPLLVLIPAGYQLDLKVFRSALSDRSLRMATQEEAERLTRLQTGGISALVLLGRGFEVFLDSDARLLDQFIVSAGVRGFQIALSPIDFSKIVPAAFLEGLKRESATNPG